MEKRKAGLCPDPRACACTRTPQAPHRGSFSGSEATTQSEGRCGLLRRKPGTTLSTPAPGPNPCALGVEAASLGSFQPPRVSAKGRQPSAQMGPVQPGERSVPFSPPVLPGKGKTSGNGFRSSRGFPADLRRSDKQICILVVANLFSIGFNQLRGVLGRGSEPVIG